LILNKEVRLEIDILQTDRYDRLLRYVYVANDFVNLEMVKGGFAVAEKIKPNVKFKTFVFVNSFELNAKAINATIIIAIPKFCLKSSVNPVDNPAR